MAGDKTRVAVVHGFTRPEFISPCDPAEARRLLELPAEGKIVLVSGGGWGVGDLSTSIDAALGLDVALVVALCGRNEELRSRLEARLRRRTARPRRRLHGAHERVARRGRRARPLDRRPDGARGLHARLPDDLVRLGAGPRPRRTTRRFGASGSPRWRARARELLSALSALARRAAAVDLSFAALPSAASLVLALVS